MWLDRVAFCETMFLVIDQSKDKTRFKQSTFLFALPFAFWFSQNVLVPCECFLSTVASLALQSTVSIVCCFLPSFYLVFLPLEFGYPSFLASLSVLFCFQFCFRGLYMTTCFFWAQMHSSFLLTQSGSVDYGCVEWTTLQQGDIFGWIFLIGSWGGNFSGWSSKWRWWIE